MKYLGLLLIICLLCGCASIQKEPYQEELCWVCGGREGYCVICEDFLACEYPSHTKCFHCGKIWEAPKHKEQK